MKKVVKGSFSVEASVILPILFGLIMILIYWGMFLYNDNAITQELYRECFEQAHPFWKQQAERKKLVKQDLLSLDTLEIAKEIGMEKIVVKGKYKMKVPVEDYIRLFFIIQNGEIKKQKEAKKTNPVKFIRTCREVERVIPKKQEE